ncbi:MAG: clostripain-related cysteine peptidase [Rikenellaceae bacterium]
MRRAVYLYIMLAGFFVSCVKEDGDVEVARNNSGVVEQTTIMYFMGTQLKSGYFDVYNIPDSQKAVAAGALGGNGRLLIFAPGYSSATLYEVYRTSDGYSTETIATYTDGYEYKSSSLTQEYIVDVISKSKDFAPANTYNIIFSGHGTGWVLQSHPYLKSVDSSYVDWDMMGSGEVVTRFMGCSTDGYMEIEELSEALESTGTKYGYLLFDMCLMSNIETLYELKDVCDNIIASPTEVMGYGFPYQTVLPALFSEDGASADCAAACYAYYDYYSNLSSAPSATVAWCVTSKLEELAQKMKQINDAGVNKVDIDDIQCYENLSSNVFCDLGEYVKEASTSSALLEEFESVLGEAFPDSGIYHTTSFCSTLRTSYGEWIDIDYFSGVSTSEPSEKFQDDWVQTSWAVATAAE